MITEFFTIQQAKERGLSKDPPAYRFVAEFQVLNNEGDEESPRWKNRGPEHILAGVYPKSPTEADTKQALDRVHAVLDDQQHAIYTLHTTEVVAPGRLCAYERDQVGFTWRFPDQQSPQDLAFITASLHSLDSQLPKAYAPALFARMIDTALTRGRQAEDGPPMDPPAIMPGKMVVLDLAHMSPHAFGAIATGLHQANTRHLRLFDTDEAFASVAVDVFKDTLREQGMTLPGLSVAPISPAIFQRMDPVARQRGIDYLVNGQAQVIGGANSPESALVQAIQQACVSTIKAPRAGNERG